MEQPNLSNDRLTFWPRVGPAGFVPDLGDDRPCANCSYNLRGLAYDAVCPECGALYGISPASERLPWDDEAERGDRAHRRQTIWAFVMTTFVVVLRPRDLGGNVWGSDPIDGKAAIAFRRICLTIGVAFLSMIVIALTIESIGIERARYCAVLDVMAIALWLNQFTHGAIHFFEDKGAGSARRRAMALARYCAAPIALMPLHWALIPMHWQLLQRGGWLEATNSSDQLMWLIAGHGVILLVQLLACGAAEAALLFQVVNLSRPAASGLALGDVLLRGLLGSIYFLGVPLLIGIVANSIGR